MKTNIEAAETAFELAALMLLEAVGMKLSPTETFGAIIAVFATAFIAYVLAKTTGESD